MPQDVIDALKAERAANGAAQTVLRKYPELFNDVFQKVLARGEEIAGMLPKDE